MSPLPARRPDAKGRALRVALAASRAVSLLVLASPSGATFGVTVVTAGF